jgi:hypothetical protein
MKTRNKYGASGLAMAVDLEPGSLELRVLDPDPGPWEWRTRSGA